MNKTTFRKKKDAAKQEIICPKLVKHYNAKMGFEDKMDMLKSLYEVDRQSKKWWNRILWYFVDLALVNSYIIFKKTSEGNTLNQCLDYLLSMGLSEFNLIRPDKIGRQVTMD